LYFKIDLKQLKTFKIKKILHILFIQFSINNKEKIIPMKKKLEVLERLELNPEILNKIQTIGELRKYIDSDVFDLTKYLDDNNIKKYED